MTGLRQDRAKFDALEFPVQTGVYSNLSALSRSIEIPHLQSFRSNTMCGKLTNLLQCQDPDRFPGIGLTAMAGSRLKLAPSRVWPLKILD